MRKFKKGNQEIFNGGKSAMTVEAYHDTEEGKDADIAVVLIPGKTPVMISVEHNTRDNTVKITFGVTGEVPVISSIVRMDGFSLKVESASSENEISPDIPRKD